MTGQQLDRFLDVVRQWEKYGFAIDEQNPIHNDPRVQAVHRWAAQRINEIRAERGQPPVIDRFDPTRN